MGISDADYQQLKKICGAPHVTREKEELVCYAYDAGGPSAVPEAVVYPGSRDEISQIMALASQKRFIVIPRGAGSGMTGGTVPVKGGIILVTSRMNQILDIDENNFIATVQPGVIVADIHKKVEAKNLFYPPDPASSSICTIGGNIGECAGGPRAVKYGVTRDWVIGLTAVLPSGEVIKTGVKTAKGVAGYDLTRLIIGSEGTLAIVTEITLKLLPKPEKTSTMAVFFNSMSHAARAVAGIMQATVIPRCVEFLDRASIDLVKDTFGFALPAGTNALLIIEVDGSNDQVAVDVKRIQQLCTSFQALKMMTAKDKTDAEKLWAARKALSPALFKIANGKINEDIVVPVDKIPDMVEFVQELQKSMQLTVVSFGHAGDGNIHCNIMYDKTDPDQVKRAHKAVDQLFAATLEMNGSITGEHGVGLTKMKYLPGEIGNIQVSLMKGIKSVFDPFNILNPGKIF